MDEREFFTEYGEATRYQIQEVIGKGSYGVVCSAVDSVTGEKVAIKKINDIFEHVSDATRILREIKLLRLLRHPDIVEVKHIMLPPSRREFKDIYVVFELMESDLHQVIKANDDLTPEHYQFFLYQLLRALKYIHTANVFHRDLKPKNVLANADCKLKICDFGLARVAFNDAPTAIFWTDYVATRWYRAPELCGSFFSKYTPAIDIWSIGCIFAEVLTGRPLFPGKNVVHQLELMTDLLGSPSAESVAKVRNEKARRYLSSMKKKPAIPFTQKFPHADPLAVRLLERMLAFDPSQRPTAEEALADPYFKGLAKVEREPSAQPITKMEFEFERKRVNMDDVKELIYREILEYHPQMLKEFLSGMDHANFLYPSAVDQFKRQFQHLEEHWNNKTPNAAANPKDRAEPLERQHASLPKERVVEYREEASKHNKDEKNGKAAGVYAKGMPAGAGAAAKPGKVVGSALPITHKDDKSKFVKSASIGNAQANYLQAKKEMAQRLNEVGEEDDMTSDISAVSYKTESLGLGAHKVDRGTVGARS
eukprot:TRINITY_DN7870_c0_g1_i1.p1 TRINITY_DN7870_c0_g1~~TRINITY_DN7870_c0_g1_i1.p1  ORF type:complete len:537 (+),score=136.56 TRINITY_DN7870_c0_g1_i1:362-1972(+)